MAEWRPEALRGEKTARWARSIFPTGLEGADPNPVPVDVTFEDQAAMSTGSASDDITNDLYHNWEILKAAGVAPASTYTTEFVPLDFWPHVVAGGVPCTPGVDYTIDGKIITVLAALELQTDEELWCRYDYSVEDEPTDEGPTFGTGSTSTQNDPGSGTYPYNHPLPSGIVAGERLLVWVGHNNSATPVAPAGWTQVGPTATSSWFICGTLFTKVATGTETVFVVSGVTGNVCVCSVRATPCSVGGTATSGGGGGATWPVLGGLNIGDTVLALSATANGVVGSTYGGLSFIDAEGTFPFLISRRGDGVEADGMGYWVADATSTPSGHHGHNTGYDAYAFLMVQLIGE